jgi:hypothetical protein
MILVMSMKETTENNSDVVVAVEEVSCEIVVRRLEIVWEFRHQVVLLALTLT